MFACTTSAKPRPVELTYPHDDVDYTIIDNLDELAARVAPYYVQVLIVDDEAEAGNEISIVNAASGIVINDRGYIVTVAHIAESTDYRAIIRTIEGRNYSADIIHVEPGSELALLRSLIPIRLPASPPRRVAAERGPGVFAIGTPDNRPGSVTAGTVSRVQVPQGFAYDKYGFDNPVILSMYVERGYSGGPAFDDSGSLLGMVVGFDAPAEENNDPVQTGSTYVIPASRLYEFLKEHTRE